MAFECCSSSNLFLKRMDLGTYYDVLCCSVTQPLQQSPYEKAHEESNEVIKLATPDKKLQSLN